MEDCDLLHAFNAHFSICPYPVTRGVMDNFLPKHRRDQRQGRNALNHALHWLATTEINYKIEKHESSQLAIILAMHDNMVHRAQTLLA